MATDEHFRAMLEIDTSNLQKGITQANKSLSVLRSEFRNLSSAVKLDPKNMTALNQALKVLGQELELATKKAELTRQKLDEISKTKGPDTVEWQRAYKAMNDADASVNRIKADMQKLQGMKIDPVKPSAGASVASLAKGVGTLPPALARTAVEALHSWVNFEKLGSSSKGLNSLKGAVSNIGEGLKGIGGAVSTAGGAMAKFAGNVAVAGASAVSFGLKAVVFSAVQRAYNALVNVLVAPVKIGAELAMKGLQTAMDGAISRFDALHQFPKILQTMGVSAEEASGATKKLSDGISGLPTSLPEIQKSVQQLFPIMGKNLDKATDSALALNNAFVAGGASSEEASLGLHQYVQMLGNGTVDAESWRGVTERMNGSMVKVAESFGKTSIAVGGDFYTAVQNGSISMEEMTQRFVELNDGADGFKNMALSATGGIEASLGNIKTALANVGSQFLEYVGHMFNAEDSSKGFATAMGALQKAILGIPQAFAPLGQAIEGVAVPALDKFKKALKIDDTGAITASNAEVAKAFGDLINDLSPIFDMILKFIGDWFESHKEPIMNIMKAWGKFVFGAIIEAIKEIIPEIPGAINEIGRAIADNLGSMGISVVAAIAGILTMISLAVLGFPAVVIGLIVTAIVAIGLAIKKGLDKGGKSISEKIWNVVKEIGKVIIAVPAFLIQMLANVFSMIFQWIGNNFTTYWAKMGPKLDQFIQGIAGWFASAPKTLIKPAWEAMKNIGQGIIDGIAGWWTGTMEKLQEFDQNIQNTIGGWVGSIGGMIGNAFNFAGEIAGKIGEWIGSALGALGGFIGGVVGAIGSWFGQIWSGIQSAFDMAGKIVGKIGEWIGSAGSALGDFISGIGSTIGGWYNSIAGFIGKAFDIGGKIVDTISGWKDAALGALESFNTWIGQKIQGIMDAINPVKIAGKIADKFGGKSRMSLDVDGNMNNTVVQRADFGGMERASGSFGSAMSKLGTMTSALPNMGSSAGRAMAGMFGGSGNVVVNSPVEATINVYGAEGQSPKDLANEVVKQLSSVQFSW